MLYEYECNWCGNNTEVIGSVDDYNKTVVCPSCRNVMKRIISPVSVRSFIPQTVGATITDKDGNDVNQFVRNKGELTDAINRYNDTERASKTGRVAVLD